MVTKLPPLGSRGFTPRDLSTLPALPDGFDWSHPNYGNRLRTDDRVEILLDGRRVAIVEPLANGAGWVAFTGCYRDDREQRHHIWVTEFDRGVDYVVHWVERYGSAIADQARAIFQTLVSRHGHRIPYERTDAPGTSQQHSGPRASGPETFGATP
ncbi:hypothetical protein [Lysobacter sp. 22409]|uniref:hypothetical protein n=1 Tax=Lysobacter sp. 22409 TaxID=3453917 RepID=UPI003F86FF70